MLLRYAARSVSVQPEATDLATFQVYYVNNGALNSKFWSAWQVRVGQCWLVAAPCMAWLYWQWLPPRWETSFLNQGHKGWRLHHV